MHFFTFSNADIYFNKRELTWRSYITAKTLPTTGKVELISKKDFTKVALDKNIKAFVLPVSFLNLELKITIYPINKAQIALLLTKKVTI